MFHPAAVGVDGRVNLFVGNVSSLLSPFFHMLILCSCHTVYVGKTSRISSAAQALCFVQTSVLIRRVIGVEGTELS
jgi:hypothetical protein